MKQGRRTRPSPTPAKTRSLLATALPAAAIFVLAAVAAIVLWPRAEAPGSVRESGTTGRIEAAASTVDLGRVPFDQMVEGRYELVNTGGRAVRLLGSPEVKTLQGC